MRAAASWLFTPARMTGRTSTSDRRATAPRPKLPTAASAMASRTLAFPAFASACAKRSDRRAASTAALSRPSSRPQPRPRPAEAPTPPPALKAMGKAKIVGNQIQVPGKIHFATDKATIDESKQETKDVLDSILKTLQENPQITRVRIEGNTDDKG